MGKERALSSNQSPRSAWPWVLLGLPIALSLSYGRTEERPRSGSDAKSPQPKRAAGEAPRPKPNWKPSRQELLRQRKQLQLLARELAHKDLQRVHAALEKAVATASPLAVNPLWKVYDLGDGQRRLLALKSLAKLGAPGQVERIFHVSLADPLLAVRRAGAEALVGTQGRDAAVRFYSKAFDQPKGLSRLGRFRAVQLMAHLGGEDAAARLRGLVKNPDPEIAAAAVEGLAILGRLDQAKFLISCLTSIKHREVRPSVVDALKQLTGQSHGANLVKWQQWLEEYIAGKWRAPSKVGDSEASHSDEVESGYQPLYRNPYKKPLTESPVDFALIFDTTGSLKNIWPEASAAVNACIREMKNRTPSLRLGAIRYRASDSRRSLSYVIKPKPLTRDFKDAQEFILDATFGGSSGGLHRGIQHAISAFAWRANARKVVLVLGDTTPSQSALLKSLRMVKDAWALDGIQFNTLFIRSVHGRQHKSTYHWLAQVGGGRFYEYNKKWSHLVDLSASKVDIKRVEFPQDTMKKWLNPKDWSAARGKEKSPSVGANRKTR